MRKNLVFEIGVVAASILLTFLAFVPVICAQECKSINPTVGLDDFSIEMEYGELFLESMGHPVELSSPGPLMNLEGDIEAVAFSIDHGGYIVVNVNDLSVPEFSTECKNPFSDGSFVFYNGPLAYFKWDDVQNNSIKPAFVYKKNKVNVSGKVSAINNEAFESLAEQSSGVPDVHLYRDILTQDSKMHENCRESIFITNIAYSASVEAEQRDGYYYETENQNPDSGDPFTSFSFGSGLQPLINFNIPTVVLINNGNPALIKARWVVTYGFFVWNDPYAPSQLYFIVDNGFGTGDINIIADDYVIGYL